MTVLSVREVLLRSLQKALFSLYEENGSDFTVLLHKNTDKSHRLQTGAGKEGSPLLAHWQNISLTKQQQKQPKTRDIIYISALPQQLLANTLSSHFFDRSKSAEEALEKMTLKIVSTLKENESKSINSEPDHKLSQPLQRTFEDCYLQLQQWPKFQIETQRPGWILFRLPDDGVAQWLQQLNVSALTDASRCDLPPPDLAASPQPSRQAGPDLANQLWLAQYTYARCCSLLRWWQQYLPDVDLTVPNQPSDVERISLMSRAYLIHALIDTADDMFWIPYRSSSKQYLLLLKSAARLCQAFEEFYSVQLSGFGEISKAESEWVRSRILYHWQPRFCQVLATKNILGTLLHSYLGAEAPCDL